MFGNLIHIGMIVSKIIADIEDLRRDISTWLLVQNINEFTSSKNAEKNGKEYLKKLLVEIEPKIKVINKEIMALNKISTLFEGNFRLKTLKVDGLRKILKARFETISKNGESQFLDQNLDLKINQYFLETRQRVINFSDSVSSAPKFERGIKKVKKEYRNGIKNAIDIMDIGIYDVSIFTSGRTVEESLNKLLKVLFSKKTIEKFDIKYTMLNKKIKILYDEHIINEKTFHDLNSLRISRNDSGHQSKIKFTKQEASDAVTQALSLLVRVEKLISKYSRK